MIYINSNTYIPNVSETLGILKTHNNMMPQFLDLDKIHQYISYLTVEVSKIEGPLFEILKYDKIRETTIADHMKNYIVSRNCASLFKKTSRGISLSKPSVEQAISSGLPEEVKLVVSTYQKYTGYLKTRTTLLSLLQNPVSNAYSFDNHRMLIVKPGWRAQNTWRVAMFDPALQNLPRLIQDLQTVPKGWVLLHTDSGQIEPRIIYSNFIPDPQIKALILLYDDAYFGVLHYVTMSEEDIISNRMEFTPFEITEELKNKRKKIKTYNNAVMYGSKSNTENDPIKDALIRRIGQHPLRLRWVDDVTQKINHGERVFKTAFGTGINISNSDKLNDIEDAESEQYELVKLAINNPIQGTAADLMRVSVSTANALLMSKSKKSYIINYVHDAGSFAIHEDEYDILANELSTIVEYKVDGWLPIKAEPEFGRNGGMFADLY